MPDARGNSNALDLIARIGDPLTLLRAGKALEADYYVSPSRVCVTDEGKVVEEGDENAAFLLAPVGGLLPKELAAELGLSGGTSLAALDKLKKADLVAIAQDQGIDGAESMKKAELVSALTETGINLTEAAPAPVTDAPAPVPASEPALPPAAETTENQGA